MPSPAVNGGSKGMGMNMGASACSANDELSAALESMWASTSPLFDDNSFASMRASVAVVGDWANAAATTRVITLTITYVSLCVPFQTILSFGIVGPLGNCCFCCADGLNITTAVQRTKGAKLWQCCRRSYIGIIGARSSPFLGCCCYWLSGNPTCHLCL